MDDFEARIAAHKWPAPPEPKVPLTPAKIKAQQRRRSEEVRKLVRANRQIPVTIGGFNLTAEETWPHLLLKRSTS